MVRLLSIIALILSIVLFPPSVLALISNNAVPGDSTYPIKRFLEDGIYAVVSVNSVSKAWFSAARSDRRFKEFSTLIAQGKSASGSLSELVVQTEIAAEELKKVEDPVKKQELIAQLSESINKYDQKLDEVSFTPPISTSQPVAAAPTPTVVAPEPIAATSPKTPTPIAATTPKSQVTPKPISTPKPAVIATPIPILTPTPKPAEVEKPTPPSQGSVSSEDVEDAKKKFEDIKKKLEEENKKSHEEKSKNKGEEKQDNRSSNSDVSKEPKVQPKGKDK